jgi:hypothetical protein
MNWFFLFLAAGILFWFIVLLYLKSYIKRRSGADYTLENLREEIRLLEADIDTKTEQNLVLLEEKIGELRQLCTEAEKRIAVYTRELGRRITEETAFTALDREPQRPLELSAAPPLGSGKRTSGKKGSGKAGGKTSGRRKTVSLLDSIEVREITAARAAGAYRAGARLPAASVPPGGTEAVSEVPLPPEATAPAEGVPAEDAFPPESRSRPARFVASANPIRAKAPPMKERVAELYRAGFSEDLVAARLGISVTEARLYIAMASNGRG